MIEGNIIDKATVEQAQKEKKELEERQQRENDLKEKAPGATNDSKGNEVSGPGALVGP